MPGTIKLLALMEATTVTGPAKNLINFGQRARSHEWAAAGLPRVETFIVTFDRALGEGAAHTGASNKFVEAARAAGLEVDVIRERFRFDPRVVEQLRRVVERRAPDVIQTHMVKSHFLVRLSGLGARRPWVAFHHGYTTTDLKMRAYNQLNRWSLPAATRVVTVCGQFARRLERAGVSAERVSVRHNSVSAPANVSREEAEELRAAIGVTRDERMVLAVGRLSREKGHVLLVEALGELRRQNPALKFKLVVVGDGPERPRVEGAARARGVSDALVFAGHRGDVRPFYAAADALALPSHSEGSPNVLLEAMAARVPVVATAVGGVPEIVSHEESALVVPPRDARALAAALARVLVEPALAARLAARAAERAASHFSPDSYTRSLIEIYRELAPDVCRAPEVAPALS